MPVPPPTSRPENPAPEPCDDAADRRTGAGRLGVLLGKRRAELAVLVASLGVIAGLSTLGSTEAARATFGRYRPWVQSWGGLGRTPAEATDAGAAAHRDGGAIAAVNAEEPDDCYECSDEVAQSRYDGGDGTVNGINIEGFNDWGQPERLFADWVYRPTLMGPEFYDRGGTYPASADLSLAENLSDPLADGGGGASGTGFHHHVGPTIGDSTPPLHVDPGHGDDLILHSVPEPGAIVLAACGLGFLTLGARSRRPRRA